MPRYVAYFRVSTQRQGRSGLGLEAQRAAVQSYLASVPGAVIDAEYQDIESGSHDDRPQLQKAIGQCLQTGATLLIAKLDRLSRNAAFLMRLQDSRVQFVAADMPGADSFVVGVLAALAQRERELISERTKAALAAAKARGQKLGGLREGAFGGDFTAGGKAVAKAADERAVTVAGHIRRAQKDGVSLWGIAKVLNEAGIAPARGGLWAATSVRNMIKRLDAMGL